MRMSKMFVATALVLGLMSPQAFAQKQAAELDVVAEALKSKVIAWRRDIHQHPELGNREFRTSALVAKHLRSLGLETKTGIAHTGVVAILKGAKPGPKVAIRADMDALPVTERTDVPFASKAKGTYRGDSVGVMHACGHDAHTAILMGVAEALVKMRDQVAGEVMFVFQPAEEGWPDGEEGGAQLMLKEGVFKDFKPDAVFALHMNSGADVGQITLRPGPVGAAADRFTIIINGKQSHAASPWAGIDPVVAAADVITTAQTIVSRRQNISKYPAVVTFGILRGGVKANVIPESVELVGTIRTLDEDMRKSIFADLKNVAESVAKAHGATADARVPDNQGYAVMINNPDLTAKVKPSLERVVGVGNVVEGRTGLGAEDFSFFAREAPGVYFRVGAKDPDRKGASGGHTPDFYIDERSLDVGLRGMLQVTMDFLNSDPKQ